MNELNHRVNNLLATVQALTAQTLKTASSIPEAAKALQSRLLSLASAHGLLTRENWEGADLRDIINQAIAPHCIGDEKPFMLEGPEVHLAPKAALAVALALHELCTNAVKYGALSNAQGRVMVTWNVADDSSERRLRLRWEEGGGPAVEKPTRKGFGSVLLTRALADDLGAVVEVDFHPTGLVCTIDARLPIEEEPRPRNDAKLGH